MINFGTASMEKPEQLHRTLRLAAQLLDNAAAQVRELPLNPASNNVMLIGTALVNIFELMQLVEAEYPSLANRNEEPSQVGMANKRLGYALLKAEEISRGQGGTISAHFLEVYATSESSSFHQEIALAEAKRYKSIDNNH